MRIFAVGDVHGCIKTLNSLLNEIKLKKTDKLIFLGDLIDRGPNSKAVLDLFFSLKSEGYDVNSIIGNHEFMMLESLLAKSKREHWKKQGGDIVLKNFNLAHPEQIPKKYFDLISSFPLFLELGGYILVHAGLNFDIDNSFEDKDAMIWERNREGIDTTKLDGKTMLVGHTPKSLDEIKESLNSSRIFLDGGCVYKNNHKLSKLFALELNEKKLYWQSNID